MKNLKNKKKEKDKKTEEEEEEEEEDEDEDEDEEEEEKEEEEDEKEEEEEEMYSSALFLISALDVGGQYHAPASIRLKGIPVSILRMQLWRTRVSSIFT